MLSRRLHCGPLRVQKPFYPEGDLCHVYLLHPPGVMAAQDEMVVRGEVAPGAKALLTTPAANKIYRSTGLRSEVEQHLRAAEDASMNLVAIDQLSAKFLLLDFVIVESGGDNLSATFSLELADLTLYVIDVAAGEKVPRKGGPAITRSDLLIINKTDLAEHVGASLEVMDRDAGRMRGERPFCFTNLKTGAGIEQVVDFIVANGLLDEPPTQSQQMDVGG